MKKFSQNARQPARHAPFLAPVCILLLLLPGVTYGARLQSTVDARNAGLRLDLPSSGNVRVESGCGTIGVEAWNENYVFVEATTTGAVASRTIPVRIERTERLLAIGAAGEAVKGSACIDVKLRVPARAQVEIAGASAEVHISGLPRALSAQTTTGNIHLEIPPFSDADMMAETPHGTIITALDGPAHSVGPTYTAHLGSDGRTVHLRSESGHITIGSPAMSDGDTSSQTGKPPTLIGGTGRGSAIVNTPIPKSQDLPQEVGEDEIIRVDTNLVTFNVSVVDRASNRGLAGLAQSDFRLYEDGVEQRLAHFESSTAPFDLLLLLDLSGSTGRVTDLIRAAALRFVAVARSQDRIAIIAFASAARIISPLTTDREALRASIKAMEPPKGSTKLYDSIAFAMDQLAAYSKDSRRRAVVVMSDGLDSTLPNVTGEGSTLPYDTLRRYVQEYDGVLYTMWVNTEYESLSTLDIQPETFALAHDRMKELANVGGGVFYEVQRYEDLAGTCERVIEDLGTVYNLAYRPTNKTRDGSWRTIRVTLPQHPNAVARGKHGYYAK